VVAKRRAPRPALDVGPIGAVFAKGEYAAA